MAGGLWSDFSCWAGLGWVGLARVMAIRIVNLFTLGEGQVVAQKSQQGGKWFLPYIVLLEEKNDKSFKNRERMMVEFMTYFYNTIPLQTASIQFNRLNFLDFILCFSLSRYVSFLYTSYVLGLRLFLILIIYYIKKIPLSFIYLFLLSAHFLFCSTQIEKPLQRHGGRLEHNETYCGSCYGAETVCLSGQTLLQIRSFLIQCWKLYLVCSLLNINCWKLFVHCENITIWTSG